MQGASIPVLMRNALTDCQSSVRKNVALSIELLLGDRNPHFQDTAIELVGYGWSVFQSLFDPFEVSPSFLFNFAIR